MNPRRTARSNQKKREERFDENRNRKRWKIRKNISFFLNCNVLCLSIMRIENLIKKCKTSNKINGHYRVKNK